MKSSMQKWIAAGLVVAAAAVVFVKTRSSGPEATVEGAMEGHDHAAMLAGLDEAQPVDLSREQARRAGVTFARVERKSVDRTIEALGRVEYDETRLEEVTPRLAGWAERLYVDFTGAPVREGLPLLDFYSPELVAAQEELILAHELLEQSPPGSDTHARAQGLVESARRRLAYWDVPEEVITGIEESGEVRRTVPLLARTSGTVIDKQVVEGARITPGSVLYRIADLSRVWVEADVFEKDLSLVREGQQAHVMLEAYPAEHFMGPVTYVYPTVDVATRTGTIRVELANPEQKLKPGMYASLSLTVPSGGPSLFVPRDAVLATGERTLVFVQEPGGRLAPREITVGLALGREIEVLSGLEEGDVVVSSASFLIDAESNLGSSMGDTTMSGEMDHSGHDMGGAAAGGDTMDHSSHDMGSPSPVADTTDHSGHGPRG
jgi:Cu(I)/Ag(I) efflux system membrane fusion protein